MEGLGHQPPCPLRQRWAQQPQEPALSGLCGEGVRAASWVRVWSPPGPRRKDLGQGLTFQHLLKLSQQGFLGDCGTGGPGGPRRPGRPRGAREASLRGGRRKLGSQWEPQPPLPWVQTPGLTDFLSRPRHRFLEVPSCGRRTKFSQVMWASENSDPRPSGGCRARGQSYCAGHRAPTRPPLLPPGESGETWGPGHLGQDSAHMRNMLMGHCRPPLGTQTRTHRART